MLNAWLWSLIPTFALAVPATTVYLHRTVTHRALTMHPVVEWWFKFANWITTGVDRGYWAVIVPLRGVGLATHVHLPKPPRETKA